MSKHQKILFSMLSLCQKFLQSVEIWRKVMTKNKFAQFFETRCTCKQLQWLATAAQPRLNNCGRSGFFPVPTNVQLQRLKASREEEWGGCPTAN